MEEKYNKFYEIVENTKVLTTNELKDFKGFLTKVLENGKFYLKILDKIDAKLEPIYNDSKEIAYKMSQLEIIYTTQNILIATSINPYDTTISPDACQGLLELLEYRLKHTIYSQIGV